MALKAENKNENRVKDYPLMTTHMARLVGITDLGHQPGFEFEGRKIDSKWKVEFMYELPNSLMEDGRPHCVWEEINVDDFEGKGLTSKMMARVRSLDPENETKDGQDLSKLLGKPCMVTLSPGKNGFPKIKGIPSVTSVALGMEVPEAHNELFAFDMDNPDLEIWDTFPKFKQEKLEKAINYPQTELCKQLQKDDL